MCSIWLPFLSKQAFILLVKFSITRWHISTGIPRMKLVVEALRSCRFLEMFFKHYLSHIPMETNLRDLNPGMIGCPGYYAVLNFSRSNIIVAIAMCGAAPSCINHFPFIMILFLRYRPR